MDIVKTEPLTKGAFAPFGDIIQIDGASSFEINQGTSTRFHDLADVQLLGENAQALISIFRCKQFQLPLDIAMMERHPLGSQAFIPLDNCPFLVVVAEDSEGVPVHPHAFILSGKQGINYHANVWHYTLATFDGESNFLVVDRGGEGDNLQEYFFDTPFQVI